jgi:hypothetical protein
MRSVRQLMKAMADRIGRLLMTEIFPEDTARVLPVSPFPPAVRIHRESDEPRSR